MFLSPALASRLARTDVVRALRGAIKPLQLQGRPLLVACSGGPDSTALLLGLVVLMPRLGFGLHEREQDVAEQHRIGDQPFE